MNAIRSSALLRIFLPLTVALAWVACTGTPGVGGSSNPSQPPGNAPPPVADGGTPGADGGTSGADAGLPDAGTPSGTDGGTGGAGGGGGGSDGGTPGPDAGTPDGGTDPAAQYDPRFIIHRSDSAACAGIGPSAVPTPVRLLRTQHTGGYAWCSGPMESDGRGDVAVSCESTLPERGWQELYSADGRVKGEMKAFSIAPLDDGFATAYFPFGGQQPSQVTFAWFDGAWQQQQYSDPFATPRGLSGMAWRGALLYRLRDDNGGALTTQRFDSHGNPRRSPRSWPGARSLEGAPVDSQGNALVLWRETWDGPLRAQWMGPDDASQGPAFNLPGASGEGLLSPLIGGGFVRDRSFMLRVGQAPDPAVPAWMATRTGPFRIVNNARAYAFYKEDAEGSEQPCQGPSVTLVAPDGTVCGTVDLVAGDATCGQPVRVGVDGTLMQSLRVSSDPDMELETAVWRWWPGLFR